MPAQVAEQPSGRGVVDRPAGLADHLWVSIAQRPGVAEAAEQDPHLGGIQRWWRLIALLQPVEQLDAQPFGQPGQAELVHPEPRLLPGHPGVELLARQCGGVVVALEPVVVQPAQLATADAFPAATGDPTPRGCGQRAGPGDERRERFASVGVPAAFMPKAQTARVQITFTPRHRARAGTQRPSGACRRRGVELRPADPRRASSPTAAIAAPGRATGAGRASGRAARPCRGARRCQITGEQQRLAVPLARTPRWIQPGTQPSQPAGLIGPRLGASGADDTQRAPAHW